MVPVDASYDVDGLDEEVPCPDTKMYGIFTYIYHKIKPNVAKYTIH